MLTLLAQLGNRSLQVDVDPQTGVITLPPETTLENGHWILLQDSAEIGAFDVTEGVVGTAYSTHPEPRVVILSMPFVDDEGEAPRPRGGAERRERPAVDPVHFAPGQRIA